ncbi:hypothetical protein [Novosphingobium olei]|uniref:Uncharacterized protein n=1 Tax=Novosphingobium olei TaxID=2728851 RepID=A0A7Y0GA72_9SPHN|nr:hypothetical protein [Novosphingobium olei]NML94775.1 hypothetical protein [Novosphingobium olei]BEV00258.1 hypothetical protein NSDW_13520 [Novosphingobium olei]
MGAAAISDVRIAAAHDGDAELVVTLTFPNGGKSLVTLDEFAARSLMASANATHADQLIGLGWDRVRDALIASSNRFADAAE